MNDIDDFLHELSDWERAYPLSAFPEPDLRKAAELLKAGGMTLDAISASNMRHVVSQIAPKARATIESLQAEVEDLKHDLDRYMKIANIECNEAEDLRQVLRVVRPYVSDRAGAGILGAIDQALAAKGETR